MYTEQNSSLLTKLYIYNSFIAFGTLSFDKAFFNKVIYSNSKSSYSDIKFSCNLAHCFFRMKTYCFNSMNLCNGNIIKCTFPERFFLNGKNVIKGFNQKPINNFVWFFHFNTSVQKYFDNQSLIIKVYFLNAI